MRYCSCPQKSLGVLMSVQQNIQELILLLNIEKRNSRVNDLLQFQKRMSQIISLHIGQGGIQLGNSCWQLFCLQHGITPNGEMPIHQPDNLNFGTYYSEAAADKYIPRAIHIDLEPTVVDEVRIGRYRNLYQPQNLISGKEDAANNYARGRYTIGRKMIDVCLERIRKEADKCSNLQGFVIYSALGGGTGSGLGSELLGRLSAEYSKKTKVGYNIYSSPHTSTTCLEPYNSILSTYARSQHQDVSIVLDNEAVYDICQRNLEIEMPTYTNINRLIAQVVSSLTYSSRFDGCLNADLKEFQTNLVAYPPLHHMLTSYSPFVKADQRHQSGSSLIQLTRNLFEIGNSMAKCNPKMGKYMACNILFRGDVIPRDANRGVYEIKRERTIEFIDWCPTGFKVGINYQPDVAIPGGDLAAVSRSCCMISNSTSISTVFSRIEHKFDLMYAKRAFVHWYEDEGMQEAEFSEARQVLAALQQDYAEVVKQQNEDDCN